MQCNDNENLNEYKGIKIESDLPTLDFEHGIKHNHNGNILTDTGIIKDKYVCVRPGNKQGVPKVYAEEIESNRIVSNNYGHGGIGWSTIWGSVKKSVDYAEQKLKLKGKSLYDGGKIAVIGSGCIGCGTVLYLIKKGVNPKNIEMFSEKKELLTSHVSGAFLSTASVLDEINSELQQIYDDINIDSYTTWDDILQGKYFNKLQPGIMKVRAYFGAEKEWGTIVTESGLEVFVQKGIIPAPELVYVKFNDRYNLMRKYNSFYFNPYKLMKGFYEIIDNDYKITSHQKRINTFNDIDNSFGVIFNCAGLGNGTSGIKNDSDIIPIAGHIITLARQDMTKINYVIYSHYIYEEDAGKIPYHLSPLFYLMPKTDDNTYTGLLGGSLINNYAGGDSNIDEKEYRGIVRRTLEIFGQDASAYKHYNSKL